MYVAAVQDQFRDFTNGEDDEVVTPHKQMFGMKTTIYVAK